MWHEEMRRAVYTFVRPMIRLIFHQAEYTLKPVLDAKRQRGFDQALVTDIHEALAELSQDPALKDYSDLPALVGGFAFMFCTWFDHEREFFPVVWLKLIRKLKEKKLLDEARLEALITERARKTWLDI